MKFPGNFEFSWKFSKIITIAISYLAAEICHHMTCQGQCYRFNLSHRHFRFTYSTFSFHNEMNHDIVSWTFDTWRIDWWKKVSVQVSLRSPRRLTWAKTFRRCTRAVFTENGWFIWSFLRITYNRNWIFIIYVLQICFSGAEPHN